MKKAEEWVKKAENENVDFILFPELSLTGFSMKVDTIRDQSNETELYIKKVASKYHIGVLTACPATRQFVPAITVHAQRDGKRQRSV